MTGGFGSGVLEVIEEARLTDPAYRDVAVRIIGIPANRFVDHGSVASSAGCSDSTPPASRDRSARPWCGSRRRPPPEVSPEDVSTPDVTRSRARQP